MGKPVKPYLKINQQIEHLISEGLIITDKKMAEIILSRVNFYHLSGYWRQFYKDTGTKPTKFKEGITIEMIYRLYQFDSELRRLIMELTEEVEIKFRTHLSNYTGEMWGPLGYRISTNFHDDKNHTKLIDTINKKVSTYKAKPIISHHMCEYGGHLPIWAVLEVISFTDMVKMSSNLTIQDKKKLIFLNYDNIEVTKNAIGVYSWLVAICDIRNMCAHYERLYNVDLIKPFSLPNEYKKLGIVNNKIFAALIVLKLIIDEPIIWKRFLDKFDHLLEKYNFTEIDQMGFVENWKDIL